MNETPVSSGVSAVDPSRLPRHLGTWNAALLLVTFTIGVGILQSPGVVAAHTGSIGLAYAAWITGAIAAVCGALVMTELAVRTPRSGGTTVFLRQAYGPRVAFMYGWTSMLLNPVAAAAITLVCMTNLGAILGFGQSVQTLLGLGWVGGIMLLNMRSSKVVARIVGGVGVFKISALATVVLLCFAGEPAAATAAVEASATALNPTLVGFSLAVIATMFAYDGWDGLALVAGEVREPARTLPRATLLGLGLILAVYLAVNTGFFHALTFAEVGSTPALAATAVGRVIGENAGRFVTVFVALSAATTVFGSLLCNPRNLFALAEEGEFFPIVARVHPKWKTPVVAIGIYGGMTMLYLASGRGFEQLTRYMILGYLPFYGLVAVAAVIARRRQPFAVGQFRMPLYPLPVVLLLAFVLIGIGSGFLGDFVAAIASLVIIGAGALLFEVWRRVRPANVRQPPL